MKKKVTYYQPEFTYSELAENPVSSFRVYRYLENAIADYPTHNIRAFINDDIAHLKFIDDEDERTLTFFVDVPPVNGADEWHIVKSFKTKKDAIDYAKENFGADDNGMVCLISES